MTNAATDLIALLGRAATFLTPPLLQKAETFVELAGEEFRKRLFLTEGADGQTLCLRPDFTIPVCLAHLAKGADDPAAYAYAGTIFRKRRATGSPEFEQAGIEWLGHTSEFDTDADLFALAMECAATVALTPRVRLGDAAMFGALIEALGVSASWRQRLTAAFGDQERLSQTLSRLSRRTGPDGLAARLAPALAKMDAEDARALVDAVTDLPGWAGPGGRTGAEIADRILTEATFTRLDPAARGVIDAYLSLALPLAGAPDALVAFADRHGLTFGAALEEFAARETALRRHGIDTQMLTFEAAFGRRLAYYTGFVFDMVDPAAPDAEVIAGGRYDSLIALLDPGRSLPAIGFSVWLDRLPGARASAASTVAPGGHAP